MRLGDRLFNCAGRTKAGPRGARPARRASSRRRRCYGGNWARADPRSAPSASAAWACRISTGPPTAPRASRPSMRRSIPARPSSTPAISTATGHNEMLIAEALSGRPRDAYQLSVKFGALRDPSAGFVGYDARPEAVKNFLAYSLKRLGVDHIDIYRPARLDPGGSDRGYGGRDRRDGRQGLCAGDRPLRGQRPDDPARRRGPSDLRPADRIFARRADDRGARSCRSAASLELA